jgi:cytochrome c peroxidase
MFQCFRLPVVLLVCVVGGVLPAVDIADVVKRLGTPDPATIPWPEGKPATAAQIELGKTLFFDRRLSSKQNLSCASCHNPELGFSDGMALGVGGNGNRLGRHSPHLFNLAWSKVLYWDGRASVLEQQALGPIQAKSSMAMDLTELEGRIKAVPAYVEAFKVAFPAADATAEGAEITRVHIGVALGAFERTLISRNSGFDRFIAGKATAMNAEAQHGLELFVGKANCIACHNGPNFTDESFHNLGRKGSDTGRAGITPGPTAQNAFKTPGLRNAALSAPYMHDGSEPTLESVVRFYNRGGDVPTPDPLVRKLDLNEGEIRDLVAFLGALTDPVVIQVPQVP